MDARLRERRRAPRLPVELHVQIQINGWRSYVTENISWRGLYVRGAPACPTGLSMSTRIFLPDGDRPLELLTTVARSIDIGSGEAGSDSRPATAGLGLDFHYLSGEVLARWEELILQNLSMLVPLPPAEVGASMPMVAATPPAGPGRLPTPRPSLILRVHSMERLHALLTEELPAGQVTARIPYRIDPNTPVDLRVIHPQTDQEYVLRGMMRYARGPGQLSIRLESRGAPLLESFRAFVDTGAAPRVP